MKSIKRLILILMMILTNRGINMNGLFNLFEYLLATFMVCTCITLLVASYCKFIETTSRVQIQQSNQSTHVFTFKEIV